MIVLETGENEYEPIDVAETLVGITEATGHNDGVPADLFMRGDPLAWCAGFVLYCYAESDWPSLYRNAREYYALRNVGSMKAQMLARGVFFGSKLIHLVWPNDLIFYSSARGSDGASGRHVGIVSGMRFGQDGILTALETIEGNYGDSVARRVVRIGNKSIDGFARPFLAE